MGAVGLGLLCQSELMIMGVLHRIQAIGTINYFCNLTVEILGCEVADELEVGVLRNLVMELRTL